jgi:hypothetical protein
VPRRLFRKAAQLGGLLASVALAAAAGANRDGPPPAHTGGFGEPTCRECHVDAGLNEPGGSVTITGAPEVYSPGRTYDMVVTVERAGLQRAGFQLAARFSDGTVAGTQAGALAPDGPPGRSAVTWDRERRVHYLQHTDGGTGLDDGAAGGGGRRWSFRWTAPVRSQGAVVLHVAGNAANDDNSPFGDFIYTAVVRIPAAQPPP